MRKFVLPVLCTMLAFAAVLFLSPVTSARADDGIEEETEPAPTDIDDNNDENNDEETDPGDPDPGEEEPGEEHPDDTEPDPEDSSGTSSSVVSKIIEVGRGMIAWLVGGTYTNSGGTVTTITFVNSAVGRFVTAITSSGFIMFFVVIAFVTMGISIISRLKNL